VSRAIPFLASSIALSHPLTFSLTIVSRLLIVLDMGQTSDYHKAYAAAKQELTDLLRSQEQISKRLVVVRQSIQTLATLCENEGIEVDPSDEASALLEDSTLADEIRTVLSAHYGVFYRPNAIKDELQRLGHDLSQYSNPQSTIHMVLKRMRQSRDVEEKTKEGKLVYAMSSPLDRFKRAHKARLNALADVVRPKTKRD
jgi:hypothetical protein